MATTVSIGNAARERERRVKEKLRRELGATVCGLLEEKDVVEVLLNPDGRLWVERLGHRMEPIGTMQAGQAESLMATVASILHTTITRENPILECELPLDGSRFEAVIPPVVPAPAFTIRRKASKVFTFANYVEDGIMTEGQRKAVEGVIARHENLLVVGGTSSGKTTFVNAVIEFMSQHDEDERLVIIEDTAELQCTSPNQVTMHATASVSMLRLLKVTMRMRPDRILVGEVRGGEALALLKAWNTGHRGGAATIHANNAAMGLNRLEELVSEVSATPRHQTIARTVHCIVSLAKIDGRRQVQEVLRVTGHDGTYYTFESEE